MLVRHSWQGIMRAAREADIWKWKLSDKMYETKTRGMTNMKKKPEMRALRETMELRPTRSTISSTINTC